jgi:hypothetical protein
MEVWEDEEGRKAVEAWGHSLRATSDAPAPACADLDGSATTP